MTPKLDEATTYLKGYVIGHVLTCQGPESKQIQTIVDSVVSLAMQMVAAAMEDARRTELGLPVPAPYVIIPVVADPQPVKKVALCQHNEEHSGLCTMPETWDGHEINSEKYRHSFVKVRTVG